MTVVNIVTYVAEDALVNLLNMLYFLAKYGLWKTRPESLVFRSKRTVLCDERGKLTMMLLMKVPKALVN